MNINISKVKIVVMVPRNYTDNLRELICKTKAGVIGNYTDCSVSTNVIGTFKPNDKANPTIGKKRILEKVKETKLEENVNYTNAKEYYMQMIEIFFDHISNNINVYSSILKKNNNSIVMDMANDAIYKDVENHIRKSDKILKTEIPVEIISKFYVSAVINVCLEYIKFPNKYEKEDILKYLDTLLPDKIY